MFVIHMCPQQFKWYLNNGHFRLYSGHEQFCNSIRSYFMALIPDMFVDYSNVRYSGPFNTLITMTIICYARFTGNLIFHFTLLKLLINILQLICLIQCCTFELLHTVTKWTSNSMGHRTHNYTRGSLMNFVMHFCGFKAHSFPSVMSLCPKPNALG